MKRRYKGWIVILIAALSVMGGAAEERRVMPAMPRPMLELKKHGTVDVTRDEAGSVESIRLIVTSYLITLDENSRPLEDMHGEKVRVLGTYSKIDDEGWFTVSSVEPIEEEAPEEQRPEQDEEEPVPSEEPGE